MNNDPQIDPVVDRAVQELRTLPPVDHVAVSRIVAAAAAARVSAADEDEPLQPRRSRVWARTLALAAAAAFAGFVLRGAFTRQQEPATQATAAAPTPVTATPVVGGDPESMPVPTAFTFENANASRVSLVGDFNKWSPGATHLVRQPGTGVWSVIVSIPPGRHVYAFMIDDSMFTLDPRAPKTRDPALGVDASVVMVGKP